MCRDTPKMLLPVEILVFMAFVFVSCFHVYNKWLKQWLGDGSSCGGGNEVDCVVCLSKVSKGEKLRALPICKHSFHVHCIDAWLKVCPTCPLCRISVAPHRNFLVSSLLTSAKTVGKLIGNPLSLELAAAVSESLGYI